MTTNLITNARRAYDRYQHFLDGAERSYPEEFNGGNMESYHFWAGKARSTAETLARNLKAMTPAQREYVWDKYSIDYTAFFDKAGNRRTATTEWTE